MDAHARDARRADLVRIREALLEAAAVLRRFRPETVAVRYKTATSPVTEADDAADAVLRRALLAPGEGWLSEETPDDPARLACRRVWVVDPLDGTREFLAGVDEWCVAVGLVEDGGAVAGGIYNPCRDEMVLGARGLGVTLNGRPVRASARTALEGATVLVSRWALRRAAGRRLLGRGFRVVPVGPVAYALALVAAGRADAMWSRSAKAEWDVAAGAALVLAAGGHASTWEGDPLRFNRWPPRVPGIVACGRGLVRVVRAVTAEARA